MTEMLFQASLVGCTEVAQLNFTFDLSILLEYPPWCAMFREEDLKAMEYYWDLNSYHRYGYGYQFNSEMACNIFSEVYKSIMYE
jgi:hypothetical protein